jgi:hypothetical protein
MRRIFEYIYHHGATPGCARVPADLKWAYPKQDEVLDNLHTANPAEAKARGDAVVARIKAEFKRLSTPASASRRSSVDSLARSSAPFRIGTPGLRSSCASIAMNSSLRRSDWRRAASICLCSVISRVVPAMATTSPFAPRTGTSVVDVEQHGSEVVLQQMLERLVCGQRTDTLQLKSCQRASYVMSRAGCVINQQDPGTGIEEIRHHAR